MSIRLIDEAAAGERDLESACRRTIKRNDHMGGVILRKNEELLTCRGGTTGCSLGGEKKSTHHGQGGKQGRSEPRELLRGYQVTAVFAPWGKINTR